MLGFIRNTKVLCALGGAAAVIIGQKIASSKITRQLAVTGLAKGMKLSHDVKEAFQSMKDDAADICYDAREEAGLNNTDEEEITDEDEV